MKKPLCFFYHNDNRIGIIYIEARLQRAQKHILARSENMGFGFGGGCGGNRGSDDSLLFFFLLLVIIFCNCGLFSDGSELLFFFLLLVVLFMGGSGIGFLAADVKAD